MGKPVVATAFLAGCFGCHISLLDIDERIFQLITLVEFHKSPINDLKRFSRRCDIGLIEGGCGSSADVRTLKEFRSNCRILVAVGECAIMGGLPALRNGIPVAHCLEEAYLNGPTVDGNRGRIIPNDGELPMMLDRVYPCHEIVKIDYSLPGCPPCADLLWEALTALATGNEMNLPYDLIKYD